MDQIEQVFVDQMLNTYFEQLIMFFCKGIDLDLWLHCQLKGGFTEK